MKTRQQFHHLIDGIKDEEKLEAYFDLIQSLNNRTNGELWNTLSKFEQEELLISYDESNSPENLVPHSLVKEQHGKWLKK
ncbi:hypothetical protein SAMN04488029_3068 [Reichenbachiella faecimaris]|uniref:Uncharacterized protein n=1 Tax=Reichenbachiella faecimaris TaxID=692418 RepID=A0A1W2GJQ6_REIFA|nr:hypothetical protein [Reichenbachiella faecimaris]SMD36784.1 hypothetical protein SAMN04488029_3068 [Reichenbachiella faecimaris]